MNTKSRIAICCLITAMILGVTATIIIPKVFAATVIRPISDVSGNELGNPVTMPDVRNTTFKVAIVVEEFIDLYGFDVQFSWPTQWIHYTSYTITLPRSAYPNPIPPSPYPGTLGPQIQQLMNVVDENDSIPFSEPGTLAWIGYSNKAPSTGMNGSGTLLVFDFVLIDQPFDVEAPSGVDVTIHFTATALADSRAFPIPHTAQDLIIKLWPRQFTYPAVPMIKVTPDYVTGYHIGETFSMDVWLMGADGGNLDPFWDVAGCDFYLNYNSTMLQALGATIDPEGSFAFFWNGSVFELVNEVGPDYVHLGFVGLAMAHTPPSGTIRIATVTFNVTYESDLHPVTPIDLENPLWPTPWFIFDADGGIINIANPLGTDWTTIYPPVNFGLGFNISDWLDEDGDGGLSTGDQLIIYNKSTGKWHDYYLNYVTGTLQMIQQPFSAIYEAYAADLPTQKYSPWKKTADTGGYYNGYGLPYWTGNFTVDFPVSSVNFIEVQPQIGAPYNLTEGVDYIVYPGTNTIELLTPLDEDVVNEFLGTMPDVDLGWPALGYIASGISSAYIYMDNGTERYASNSGYHSDLDPSVDPMPAGGEWWFDPDFPYELESWWATGYVPGPWTWPDGTDIYANYTAPAWIVVDYNAEPDLRPYYMEFPGAYADFLALGDPLNTVWHEVHPRYSNSWNVAAWVDADTSGDITVGDTLTMNLSGTIRDYVVNGIATDIKVTRMPCVQDLVPGDPFYTDPIIVDIAGFPHPERTMSPWYGRDYAVPLPNAVENSQFEAIPEYNSIFAVLLLMSATTALMITKRWPKKK